MNRGKGKKNCVRSHYCLAVSEDGHHIFGIISFFVISANFKELHPDMEDESDIWQKVIGEAVNNIKADIDREKILNRCLFVADREADDFELMQFLSKAGLGFVIRGQYNRKVFAQNLAESEQSKLFALFPHAKKHGASYKVKVQDKNETRRVVVERRVLRDVSITPPANEKTSSNPLQLNFVKIQSKDPAEDLSWMLWTTEKITSAQSSAAIVEHYSHRWKIEEVNKGAKTGVRVEDRQFTDLDNFYAFMIVCFIIGWRIVATRTLAIHSKKEKLEESFCPTEVSYLKAQAKKMGLKMKFLHDAINLIAKLGGFTSSYENPGWIVLWQGWIRFYERSDNASNSSEIRHYAIF